MAVMGEQCKCPTCGHWFLIEKQNLYSDRKDEHGDFIVTGSVIKEKQYCRDCRTLFDHNRGE